MAELQRLMCPWCCKISSNAILNVFKTYRFIVENSDLESDFVHPHTVSSPNCHNNVLQNRDPHNTEYYGKTAINPRRHHQHYI